MCFWRHDWGAWEDCVMDGVMFWDHHYTEAGQRRRCQRCGKLQLRSLR